MANNKSIQILRGDANAIANNANLVLLDGQPLYDKDNHNLYIGDGTTTLANLNTVNRIKTNASLGTVAICNKATASGTSAIAFGYMATASNSATIALGLSATASGSDATALGYGATASRENATALGALAKASNSAAIALGHNATANGSIAIALGEGAASSGLWSMALGALAKANKSAAIALGFNATASGMSATAIGASSTASGVGATAIGVGAKASSNDTIVLGSTDITSLRCQVQTISALSDSRVKEDVALANTAQCLVDVNRLPVSRFKYKDFTGTHLDVHRTGFMADDVEKVFPKAVAIANETFPVLDEEGNKVYEQEVDEEGNPVYEQAVDESGVTLFNEDGSIKYDETRPVMKEKTFVIEDVKSVAMEMVIPTLWAAVQELTKRLEVAEAKIAELENK